jgi:hypothetical protein
MVRACTAAAAPEKILLFGCQPASLSTGLVGREQGQPDSERLRTGPEVASMGLSADDDTVSLSQVVGTLYARRL